jgi:hypothetical protein
MSNSSEVSKEVLWKARVEEFTRSNTSRSEYCRRLGIRSQQLGYWEKRLGFRGLIKAKLKSKGLPRGAFAEAQVIGASAMGTPLAALDAKWVAEFIIHLSGGLQ